MADVHGDLRSHLLRWDPIGVADEYDAQDEYDNYISRLLHMLKQGTSSTEITNWLTRLVADDVGLDPDGRRERALADTLIAWWAAHDAG